MKIKKTVLLLILIHLLTIAFPQKNINSEQFHKAKDYYTKGDYTQALKIYKNYLKNGYDNFEINYNIGNCYFKMKSYGKSRYYYDRALSLNPAHGDLLYNIKILYQKLNIPPAESEQYIISRKIIFIIPGCILFPLNLILIISILVLLILLIKKSEMKRLFLILLITTTLLSFTLTALSYFQKKEQNKPGFTTITNTEVYLGPSISETVLQNLNEGYSNQYTGETSRFIRMKLDDGLTGWILKEHVIYQP